jgi:hypothetical protein
MVGAFFCIVTTEYTYILYIQGGFLLSWPVPRLCALQQPVRRLPRGAYEFFRWISMPDGRQHLEWRELINLWTAWRHYVSRRAVRFMRGSLFMICRFPLNFIFHFATYPAKKIVSSFPMLTIEIHRVIMSVVTYFVGRMGLRDWNQIIHSRLNRRYNNWSLS